MMRVAFFGVGNMGGPMAGHLVKAGFEVVAFDPVQQLLDKVAEQGVATARTPDEALAGADAVLSMLPHGQAVESLYVDDMALLDRIATGTLIVDCSTVAAETSRRVAQAGWAKGLDVVDAPVSGGVAGAVNATLTFMLGGETAVVDQVRPILQPLGRKVLHAGPHGSGQIAKICNNMLLAVQMAGTAEALELGSRHGLDPAVLSEVLQNSSGRNWPLEVYNPYPGVMDQVPASREYEGGFLVDLMHKDLGLAMDAAVKAGAPTPMGGLARNLYALHRQSGYGGKDFSSIQRMYSRSSED